MTDWIIALAALTGLGAFLGILAWRVPELDLLIVLGVVFALAVIDFAQSLWPRRKRD